MPTADQLTNPPDVRVPERSLEEVRAAVLDQVHRQMVCEHQWDYIGYRLIEDHWLSGLVTDPKIKHYWVKCPRCQWQRLITEAEYFQLEHRVDATSVKSPEAAV